MIGIGIVGEAGGLRDGEVVEAGDVPELEGKVDGGFAVGCEEGAIFGRMLPGAQGDVEGLLDGGDGAGDVEVDTIGRSGDDGEAVFIGEIDDSAVVVFGGTELRGELFDGEEVAVAGAGGIVEIVEQGIEFGLVAQGKGDGETKSLRAGHLSQSFGSAGLGFVTDVMGEEGLGLGHSGCGGERGRGEAEEGCPEQGIQGVSFETGEGDFRPGPGGSSRGGWRNSGASRGCVSSEIARRRRGGYDSNSDLADIDSRVLMGEAVFYLSWCGIG
jgi:hypothetical protein